MDTFPLYSSLVQRVKKTSRDLSKSQKEFFVNSISTLPEHVHEIISAVIMYGCRDNLDTTEGLPLGAQFIDTGTVQFNFNIFPRHLKHLLYEFIKLHTLSDDLFSPLPASASGERSGLPGSTDETKT